MTFIEVDYHLIKNLPAGEFRLYWLAAVEKMKSKEGQEQKQSEVLEDELTDGMGM